MNFYRTKSLLVLSIIFTGFLANAQIETTVLNQSIKWEENKVPFFTNRTIIVRDDNSFDFKNSTTKQTNTLYFCNYNFDTDSIELDYRAVNLSDKYPVEKTKHNVLYEMYENNRLKRGVKNFYFIVGGYGKSFNKQINSYMRRLKTNYGDSLFNKAVICVFAWGTEEDAYQYYNALRASKRGAADFAIFQHMLDEFLTDSDYFKTHPKDITVSILFCSMGNELFRDYLISRAEQKIPLVKTYHRILFVGSVAPRNEFEKGNAFYNLHEMTDTVDVYVNSKDILLKMSSVAHLKNRMGNKGPKNPEKLLPYINVVDIKDVINLQDMKGLGHDYLLTNPVLQDEILESIKHNLEQKE